MIKLVEKIVEYRILRGANKLALENYVMEYLDAGYELLGAPFCDTNLPTDYMQAVIRKSMIEEEYFPSDNIKDKDYIY